MTETAIRLDSTLQPIGAASAAHRPAPLDWLMSFRGLDPARIEQDDFVPAAEWIREGLDADNVHIVLGDAAQIRPVGSAHAPHGDSAFNTASEAILAAVLRDGQTILFDNAGLNTPFAADPQLQRFNIVSVLCVPLTLSGRRLGAIYADARDRRPWNEGDLAVLELAAGLLALVWDHRRLLRQTCDTAAMAEAGLAAQKMSHAVKNILQVVCGAGEVIDYALKNKHIDRIQRSWDILGPNLQRMKKFTLDMLDYSRPRPFEFAPANPAALIVAAAESFAAVFSSRNIRLDLRLDAAPKSVMLDSSRFTEMMRNMILYCLDCVGPQPGWLRIECRPNASIISFEILISDSGKPLDRTDDDFFAPYEPNRDQLSTGLGLAIARRIAETHNGSITFDLIPTPHIFRITLPLNNAV